MKKYRNKKYFYLLLVFIFGFVYIYNLYNKSYINDYYNYINYNLFLENEIDSSEVGWSNFTKAQDIVNEEVKSITKEIIDSKSNGDINIFYNSYINTSLRDKNGLGILDYYLKLIDSSKDIDDFINKALVIEKELMIDIFMRISISPDFKDNSKNIVYFYPISFDFGVSCDYYINPDYSRYHALIKQHQIKLLKEYGYDKKKARDVSSKLDNFFTDISKNSKTSSELSDVESLYKIISKDDLQNIYTNLNIDKYLNNLGISNEKYFSIVDTGNYEVLNKYLTNDNLSLLKEYVKVKILENYGGYLSSNYSNIVNNLNNQLMGIYKEVNVEDDAINSISSIFSNEVDRVYLERNFSDEDYNFIDSMVRDIIKYYENNLKENNWLESSTKEKAILKLKNMKVNIGGEVGENVNYNLNSKYLIDNVIKINKVLMDEQLKMLEGSYELLISPTVVNAYYNPLDNSINFPASLKELYQNDYYEALGSIGFIIGHEITHAFDNIGSKFDHKGNLNNWWSKSDYIEFEKKQKRVIEYYNQFEASDGIYVNGSLTVSENISDLGSMKAILEVAKSKGASYDDFKVIFSSYARMWASEYNESYQKLLYLNDVHAPDKIRVNAVLSSQDIFYEVYDISEKDLMYIEKSKRVSVW